MEKRKLSGKTILKLAGALLALAYLGFYFYVGITGKLPYMHETVHIMRYGDRKKWVAGGMTAAMILGICINSALNDLNLKRIRKESFLPLFFTMIFPIILLLLLEAFLAWDWHLCQCCNLHVCDCMDSTDPKKMDHPSTFA